MGDTGDQGAEGCHLLGFNQSLLGHLQVVIGLGQLFIALFQTAGAFIDLGFQLLVEADNLPLDSFERGDVVAEGDAVFQICPFIEGDKAPLQDQLFTLLNPGW